MKKLVLLVAAAMALSFAVAQDKTEKKMETKKEKEASAAKGTAYKGYLADMMCGKRLAKDDKKGAKHTVACALEEACAESGYGLTFDGAFHKFDAKGDKLAGEWLQKLQADGTKDNLMFEVNGKVSGGDMAVTSMKPMAAMPEKEEKKEEPKKEEVKKN